MIMKTIGKQRKWLAKEWGAAEILRMELFKVI
jgi:hypothetical protein